MHAQPNHPGAFSGVLHIIFSSWVLAAYPWNYFCYHTVKYISACIAHLHIYLSHIQTLAKCTRVFFCFCVSVSQLVTVCVFVCQSVSVSVSLSHSLPAFSASLTAIVLHNTIQLVEVKAHEMVSDGVLLPCEQFHVPICFHLPA